MRHRREKRKRANKHIKAKAQNVENTRYKGKKSKQISEYVMAKTL